MVCLRKFEDPCSAEGIHERWECAKLFFVRFKIVWGTFSEELVEWMCSTCEDFDESSVDVAES